MTFEQQKALSAIVRRNIFVLANAAANFADEVIGELAEVEPARERSTPELPKQSKDSFLNKKQVAELLNVSETTINNLMNEGLPFEPISKRGIRFIQADVLEWVKTRNVKGRRKKRLRVVK